METITDEQYAEGLDKVFAQWKKMLIDEGFQHMPSLLISYSVDKDDTIHAFILRKEDITCPEAILIMKYAMVGLVKEGEQEKRGVKGNGRQTPGA